MPAAASNTSAFVPHHAGGWCFQRWGSPHLMAGVADRRVDPQSLLLALNAPPILVQAGQVHGASLARVGRLAAGGRVVAGCDALLADMPGVALLVRTADCLPVFLADPARGVIGIAHVGWRGLAKQLPLRLIAALRRMCQSRVEDLIAAIGPAIHACCYEVGPEFAATFGAFVQMRGGRRTCDLIGAALAQLRGGGIAPDRLVESGHCTACEARQWYSVRREGDRTGRLTSFIWWRR